MALAMLTIAVRPADDDHPHGHTKAEYFSSAFEGFLIFGAAVWIAIEAIARLRDPRPVQAVSVGLLVAVVATGVNFVTARTLMTVGRASRSITLEADAHHLFTDVWTSIG
jgi:cation diffusion facilitator family transporter